MGLSRTAIQLLLEESSVRPFQGSVATLGRQHVYFTWDEFLQFATAARAVVPAGIVPRLHREPKLCANRYAADDSVMAGLGFTELVTIDYSNYEDVAELLDLNQPDTPPQMQNRFDVILDIGTIEHVFHLPNVLAHLHRMLKPQGRVIHLTPAANFLDHGFYCFSPTFFADYYAANRYQIHQIRLCRYSQKDNVNSPMQGFDYLQPKSWQFEVGSLDDCTYNTWVVARKTPESTAGAIPQQSFYVRQWADSRSLNSPSGIDLGAPAAGKADRLLKLTAGWPFAHRLAQGLVSVWRNQLQRYRRRHRFPLPKACEYH